MYVCSINRAMHADREPDEGTYLLNIHEYKYVGGKTGRWVYRCAGRKTGGSIFRQKYRRVCMQADKKTGAQVCNLRKTGGYVCRQTETGVYVCRQTETGEYVCSQT